MMGVYPTHSELHGQRERNYADEKGCRNERVQNEWRRRRGRVHLDWWIWPSRIRGNGTRGELVGRGLFAIHPLCSIGLDAGIAISAGDPLAGRVGPVALGLGRHDATACVAIASADAVGHVAVASVALTVFRAAGQARAVLGVADAVGGTRGEVTGLCEEAGGSGVFYGPRFLTQLRLGPARR